VRRLHRAKRAVALRGILERGPCWDTIAIDNFSEAQAKEARRQYVGWAKFWILRELDDLIPELRKSSLGFSAAESGPRSGNNGIGRRNLV